MKILVTICCLLLFVLCVLIYDLGIKVVRLTSALNLFNSLVGSTKKIIEMEAKLETISNAIGGGSNPPNPPPKPPPPPDDD